MSSYNAHFLRSDTGPTRLFLQYEDKRMSKIDFPHIEMRISALMRIHEFVSSYFRIEEEWSEKLIERLLGEDLRFYHSFELGTREREDIRYHIQVLGETDGLWDYNSGIEYTPLFKRQELSIHSRTNRSESRSVWTYEKLEASKMDNSLIALFNNNTFNLLLESNRAGTQKRIVKVIDLPADAAKL